MAGRGSPAKPLMLGGFPAKVEFRIEASLWRVLPCPFLPGSRRRALPASADGCGRQGKLDRELRLLEAMPRRGTRMPVARMRTRWKRAVDGSPLHPARACSGPSIMREPTVDTGAFAVSFLGIGISSCFGDAPVAAMNGTMRFVAERSACIIRLDFPFLPYGVARIAESGCCGSWPILRAPQRLPRPRRSPAGVDAAAQNRTRVWGYGTLPAAAKFPPRSFRLECGDASHAPIAEPW